MHNFYCCCICPACWKGWQDLQNDRQKLVVEGWELQEVEQFLGDMIDCVAEVETVRMREVVVRVKWKEMASLLAKHSRHATVKPPCMKTRRTQIQR